MFTQQILLSLVPQTAPPPVEGWNISLLSFVTSFSVLSEGTAPSGVFFKPDGSKMFVSDDDNNAIYEYTLSTPWNIGTASYTNNQLSVATRDTNPSGVFFSPDGLKIFVSGNSSNSILLYTLSSAWDITTASYTTQFSVNTQDDIPTDVFFKPDGTIMYVSGARNDSVYQYGLSTAWDISTASYIQAYSVATQDGAPESVFFRTNGTKMYIVGPNSDAVHEYNLNTAWDISTASFLQSKSISAQDGLPRSIFFNATGTLMFMVGDSNNSVYAYTL